ncbi:MAG: hypothetical protein CVV14_08340 [Gammaproteobacteria bacterium HGW-Gammaproteobacteria-4]|nr:MAG: hypothetical protein CVV14_08340 [Gammaproteobacteria bacterium HGW-Gammaproteobacteria-4]
MSASATPPGSAGSKPPATLAAAAFPRRVRRLLEGILEYASDEMERILAATLNDAEQQLFKLAEQARSNEVQQHCFEALRTVKRSRSDLTPQFMVGLEAELASLREARKGQSVGDSADPSFERLALVEHGDANEATALREIASRLEIRNSLPLYLLGQRFGVLVGQAAFDPEQLPIGPHGLTRIMANASRCLDLSETNRLVVLNQFDKRLSPVFAGFVEAINTFLIREGVLPHLNFVPVRSRPGTTKRGPRKAEPDVGQDTQDAAPPQRAAAAPHAGTKPARGQARPAAEHPAPMPLTSWPGIPEPGMETDGAYVNAESGEDAFHAMRDLLSNRRALLGKLGQNPASNRPRENTQVASGEDVQSVLGILQQKANHAVLVDGKPTPRSVTHVKQDLLSQLRSLATDGKSPALAEEDTDTIDLVGMLFDVLMRDVTPRSPAAALLAKLQVPLLRVALRDKAFFTQQRHPARKMLNAVAETGAFWANDEDADRGTVEKMQILVDRVVGEFDGDVTIFDNLLNDLGGHMQTVARKAEVSERRHVDAARGKEKLVMARLRASDEISNRLSGKKVPRFVKTLLSEAWADVLALSLLRQGEQSPAFQQQLAIAEKLIASASDGQSSDAKQIAAESETLREEIEHSLAQVGYHAEDAQAIAARLAHASEPESGDGPVSQTELALRLKARSRLGADVEDKKTGKKAKPLSDAEKAAMDRIKQLPFGTWFEFSDGPGGAHVRRRMSWFSTVTGHILFVNHRGQRVGEQTIESVGRAMAAGTASVVMAERTTLIDRAWNSIMSALKSFSGKAAPEGSAA